MRLLSSRREAWLKLATMRNSWPSAVSIIICPASRWGFERNGMSTGSGQRGSLDVESDMLPQDPPPWIIRWTAWLLLGFVGFAFILSIVMKLPETVRCPFVLVPAAGADPVQAPRQG